MSSTITSCRCPCCSTTVSSSGTTFCRKSMLLSKVPSVSDPTVGQQHHVTCTCTGLGSPGATTQLHYDTYGCNLVAQHVGCKKWILFPPNSDPERMGSTRIPFEESTVYSTIDVFDPAQVTYQRLPWETALEVDLNPGDILFVPPRWWHAVTNTTCALATNVWLPHGGDEPARKKEALVSWDLSHVALNKLRRCCSLMVSAVTPMKTILQPAVGLIVPRRPRRFQL